MNSIANRIAASTTFKPPNSQLNNTTDNKQKMIIKIPDCWPQVLFGFQNSNNTGDVAKLITRVGIYDLFVTSQCRIFPITAYHSI